MNISVLGAGAFGTALAISLARADKAVTLWARDSAHVAEMKTTRENGRRLPGTALPARLTVTGDLTQACQSEVLLLVVPMQRLAEFLAENRDLLVGKKLVACCKGVDLATGRGPIAILNETCPDSTAAILTGPSFALDIAAGLPTALTIACADSGVAGQLQTTLSTGNLRLYRTTDTTGAELGGALKNVIAIACGAAIGAGFGESARAAVMTRGYAEVSRLAIHLGARPETLAGLSGFGDLTLTCTSEKSRNYRFGLALGQGSKFDPTTTVEGSATAEAVSVLARKLNIDMPLTDAVTAVLTQETTVKEAMEALLSRPLKQE